MDSVRHILSKSTYIRGLQCLKSLYLHKNRPFLRDKISPEQLAKFKRGHEVGLLAQQLFPGGVNCAPAHPAQFKKSLELTHGLVSKEVPVIYEAAFSYNDVLIFLDILVKTDQGWDAYEVKSSLSVSETYLLDAALQYHVLSGAGVVPDNFYIIYLDENYRKSGETDIHQLFKTEDVSLTVREMQNFTERFVEKAKESVQLKKSPPVEIGRHCFHPYPCDFQGHCWKNLSEDSVFNVKGIPKARRLKWMESGFATIGEIPDDQMDESEKQIIDIHIGSKEWINPGFVKKINNSKTPIFLSFLVVNPAVPVFEGTGPFQSTIAGLGWMKEVAFSECFIAAPGKDPRFQIQAIISSLLKNNPTVICHLKDTGLQKKDIIPGENEYDLIDLDELFSSENYYRAGIDPEASFHQNLKKLLPTLRHNNKLTPTMAGVRYLNLKKGEKDSVIDEFNIFLEDNLKETQLAFDYLKTRVIT